MLSTSVAPRPQEKGFELLDLHQAPHLPLHSHTDVQSQGHFLPPGLALLFLLLGTALSRLPTHTLSTRKTCHPPTQLHRPLDGPFSGRAEEPFWKSAGLFPAPGLCTCCFLCLSTSFSSFTNKLQLTFKTRPSGHLLCEALLDVPVRTSYLPPLSSPRPLHHSPVTICICDDSPPPPGGPLGQGWGLSPLGSPRETLESCTNTLPILSQPLCCLRLEILVPVMSRPCPQAPSLAREF